MKCGELQLPQDKEKNFFHLLHLLHTRQLKSWFVPRRSTCCTAAAGGKRSGHGQRAGLLSAFSWSSSVQLSPLPHCRPCLRYLWETKGKEAWCFCRCLSSLARSAGEHEALPAVCFCFFFDFVIPDCEFRISVMNHDFWTGRCSSDPGGRRMLQASTAQTSLCSGHCAAASVCLNVPQKCGRSYSLGISNYGLKVWFMYGPFLEENPSALDLQCPDRLCHLTEIP